MPFSANCPACGAPVVFKSSASFHGVCEFCRSTLVRHGGNLENLGRMADLIEDASPIRLGTEGVHGGMHFAVIGRIQLRYVAGVWNEWHILFDNQRSGWLSDAGGEYILSFLTPPADAPPAYEALRIDGRLVLAKQEWVVTNKEEALCVAGEGELPFAFGAGYPAQLADLRGADESGAFASIDYSETPPLFFVGRSHAFASFNFANLRDGSAAAKPAGPVKSLQCPSCGGPISVHDKAVLSVACPACLTILDAENESLRVLQKVMDTLTIEPRLALGSVGRFAGKDWTVIGFQQRSVKPVGLYAPWEEYLLHHPTEGFRWLVDSEGHWSWVSPLTAPPRYADGQPAAVFQGQEFRRYSGGTAVTRYVIGEFTWKVTLNEEWETLDFVAPPRMLSREMSGSELTWSLGDYLPPEEVATAFGLTTPLPKPKDIGPCQPNPRVEAHRRICANFWKFLGLAVVAQVLWFFILGSRTLLDQRLVFSPGKDEPVTTQTFQLASDARNIVLRHETDLDNNWLGLGLTLIEKTSGRAWVAQSDVAYWHGSDGGESWSEGDRSRELVFRDLPAGTYYFVIDPEISAEKPVTVTDRIKIVRDQAAWSNFFFLLVFIALFPLFSRYRVSAFEAERWKDADFLSSGAEFGSDDSNSGDDD
jgi:ribosomal protein S27E